MENMTPLNDTWQFNLYEIIIKKNKTHTLTPKPEDLRLFSSFSTLTAFKILYINVMLMA